MKSEEMNELAKIFAKLATERGIKVHKMSLREIDTLGRLVSDAADEQSFHEKYDCPDEKVEECDCPDNLKETCYADCQSKEEKEKENTVKRVESLSEQADLTECRLTQLEIGLKQMGWKSMGILKDCTDTGQLKMSIKFDDREVVLRVMDHPLRLLRGYSNDEIVSVLSYVAVHLVS